LVQNYEPLEIVIADDGSTDGTVELLYSYLEEYPNIFRLQLSKENIGISKNSNLAHFACKGKYIAWMGGDDLMLPGKLKKQVLFMEKNPDCNISYHNLDVFLSGSNTSLFLMNSKKNTYEGGIEVMIKYGCFNGACSTMVRGEATPHHGFDERIPIASDWLFWVESLSAGGKIRYIDEVLGRYRRHDNNVTNKKGYSADLDHLNSCNILLTKFPHLYSVIIFRYSELLRGLRYKESKSYLIWLKASILLGFNWRSVVLTCLHILSFGRVRK
jgi:glycosyltransferase involved in cell wall biosynthesis